MSSGAYIATAPPFAGAEKPTPGADDAALVKRLLAGDEAAFSLLVDRWHGSLVRMARGFVKSDDVAEEVAQDTWVAVLDGLRGFESRSSLKTWVFRILVNRAITRAGREGRSVPFSSLGKEDEEQEPAPDRLALDRRSLSDWSELAPEQLLLRKETQEVISREIDKLPPNQRAVVVLRDVEGIDSEEACNILGISEINQRVLLHRGRSRLRVALERYLQGTTKQKGSP